MYAKDKKSGTKEQSKLYVWMNEENGFEATKVAVHNEAEVDDLKTSAKRSFDGLEMISNTRMSITTFHGQHLSTSTKVKQALHTYPNSASNPYIISIHAPTNTGTKAGPIENSGTTMSVGSAQAEETVDEKKYRQAQEDFQAYSRLKSQHTTARSSSTFVGAHAAGARRITPSVGVPSEAAASSRGAPPSTSSSTSSASASSSYPVAPMWETNIPVVVKQEEEAEQKKKKSRLGGAYLGTKAAKLLKAVNIEEERPHAREQCPFCCRLQPQCVFFAQCSACGERKTCGDVRIL